METLGNIGNFYIVLLFGILIAGIGVLSLNFSRKIWSSTESLLDKKGGKLMNKWLKLAVASFAGLLIASFALGLTNSAGSGTDGSMGGMMGSSTGGSGAASSQNHAAHHPGAQQSGNDASAANWAGYSQGMNNAGGNMEAQMYMMQTQIQQLQQQWSYMMQMHNQQGYYPGPMGIPGYMNQNQGMSNMNSYNSNSNSGMNMGNSNSSMGNQSSSGGNSGGGMGMM